VRSREKIDDCQQYANWRSHKQAPRQGFAIPVLLLIVAATDFLRLLTAGFPCWCKVGFNLNEDKK
jgi:hypothetical protein